MKVTVIIPVWNGRAYLSDCLDSLVTQDYPDFEIIAVDNASRDGSVEFVTENYPSVRLICNRENLGFIGACNKGLQVGEGEVLILLNQDTLVKEGWLTGLVNAFSVNADAGIVGCKARYPDGRLQHAGGYVDIRGNSFHYGRGEIDVGQFDERREVDFVTGAGLAISRTAFESVGGLDEGYALGYYEDIDWCYRVSRAGFQVLYEPTAVMVHKEASLLTTFDDHRRVYLPHRNRLRFVFKHTSLTELREAFLPAERTWLRGLGEGEEYLVSVMHRIFLYYLLNLRDLLEARRPWFESVPDEADTLADILLTLRTVIPLKPAGLGMDETVSSSMDTSGTDVSTEADKSLSNLRASGILDEPEFHSEAPLIGDLISSFREQWNSVSTKWYVRALIQQQMEFNAQVVTMFEHLCDSDRRLASVFAEYIREDGREIVELSRRLQDLYQLLEENPEP